MQTPLCSRCGKNPAVVFITRLEAGQQKNEGLCIKCARELHIKPVDDIMNKMGISDDDLDMISEEMKNALSGVEDLANLGDAEGESDSGEDDDGKTATFPFLNRLFGGPNGPGAQNAPPPQGGERPASGGERKAPKHKFLDAYCIDLTGRAEQHKLDAMIGREEELERVIQILNRRQKNNPCLIGEPGVGKTAIAEGLAQRIAAGNVPFKLQNKRVYLLDLTALVAGTQFRGQFESRMKGLIEEIRREGNIILVIDEVHNIVGAGDAEGSMNAANILKPALSRGEIQVIGATTFTEYRKHIEKDSALERRFQPVTVNEPSLEDSIKILEGIAHLAHRTYTQISGGEQQLVLIARALAQNARTIVMDEPTSALDYGNTVRVLSTIRSLAREGLSILQSTHQPDQAFLYSDRTLVLNRGRVLAFGRPQDVITRELISEIYHVDVEVNSLYDDRVRVCVPVQEIER